MNKWITFAVLILSTSTCPDEENCLACIVPTKECVICQNSFVLNGRCISPAIHIEHCMLYESESTCQSCDFGYGVNADHTACVECMVENCAFCSDEGFQCIACFTNTIIDFVDNKCVDVDATATKHCLINGFDRQNEYKCEWCADGYTNRINVCETWNDVNCAFAPENKCEVCKLDYHVGASGKCMPNKRTEQGRNSLATFDMIY